MTRRLRDIVLLLESILDAPFAQPQSWTSELVRRNAKRGELPANRVRCPACNGEKRRRVRGVFVDCDRCVGKAGKPLGWIYVDLMIRERFRRKVGSIETGIALAFRTVHCDVCAGSGVTLSPRWRGDNNRCDRCNGSGRIELLQSHWRAARMATNGLDAPPPVGDAVLASMEARKKAGSYDELMAALQALNGEWPALYRLVRDIYILGMDVPSERLQRLAREGGLAFLEARMPEEIKVPAGLRRREQQEVAA